MVIDSGKITGSLSVSGSYTQTGNAVISGSLTVSGSINATITGSITSASYASYAETLDGLDSTNFTLTSSFQNYTSSANTRLGALEAATASLYTATSSFSGRVGALEAATASLYSVTSSFNAFSASVLSYTSSINAKTSSFATTGSNAFIGTQTITGSILQSGSFTSTGTITAQTLVVQTVSSSVIYSSGSNIFGNNITNTQTLTGSVIVTGSVSVNGSSVILTNQTSSMSVATASYAGAYTLTSSFHAYTSSNDLTNTTQSARLSALEAATASIYTATASFSGRVGALEATTASLFSYTSSNDAKIASIYTTTSSLNASVAALNAQSASLLSFTASTILTDATQSARLSGLEAASASINSYTSSNDAKITSIYSTTSSLNASIASLNSYTASNTLTDATQSVRLSALEAATASLYTATSSFSARVGGLEAQSASLLSYTSSTDAKIASIYTTTSSLNAAVSSLNTATSSLNASVTSLNSYTSSTDAKIASIYSTTSSLNASVTSLNAQTASLLSYTSSNNTTNTTQNTRLSALEAATASLYSATSSFSGRVGALEAATASLNNFSSSHNNATASLYNFSSSVNTTTASLNTAVSTLNTYTSSINAKTSSFATTGSNTFIGTQTITGSIFQSGSFTTTGTITAQTLVVQVITSSQNFITGSTKFGTLTSNTHQFTGSVSASGSLNINNGVLYADGTNVGIGTTNPGYKLHVVGDTYINGIISASGNFYMNNGDLYGPNALYFNDPGAGEGINWQSGNGWSIFESPYDLANTAGNLQFYRNWNGSTGTRVFTLDSSSNANFTGNVGIGTNAPGTLLDIQGTATDTYVQIRSKDTSISEDNEGTRVRFSTSDTTYLGHIGYVRTNSSLIGMNLKSTNHIYLNSDSTGVTMMYLSSSGFVGIGTLSPGSEGPTKLYVNGTQAIEGARDLNWGGFTSQLLIRNSAGAATDVGAAIGFGSSNYGAGGIVNAFENTSTVPATYMAFHTRLQDGTIGEKVRISSVGNVGIGTTSPSAKLDILGSARITNVSGSGNFLSIKSTTGNYGGQVDFYENSLLSHAIGSTGANNTFFIKDEYNNAIRILINNGGNVGIGTTDPTATLHLRAASPYIYLDDTSTAGTLKRFKFVAGDVGSTQTMTFGFETTGSTNSISVMSLSEIGNVGIGTLSPNQLLHLKTELAATSSAGSAIQIESGGAGGDQGWIGVNKGTGNGLEFSVENRDIIFNTGATTPFGGTERMRIATGGNVGIGTASPSYRLDVQGGNARFVAAASADALFRIIAANYETEYKTRLFLGERDDLGMTIEYDGVSNIGYLGMNDSVDPTGSYSKRIQMSRAGTEVTFPAGSVGIGTTSPTDKLEVRGVDNGITISSLSANRPVLQLINGSTMMLKLSANGTYGAIADTTGDLMIFKGGSVGIGSTSPAYKLDVSGDINFSTSLKFGSVTVLSNSSTDVYANIRVIRSQSTLNDGMYIGYDSTGTTSAHLRFFANGQNERMRIDASSGSVGIGTTSPGAKLDVYDANASGTDDIVRAYQNLTTNHAWYRSQRNGGTNMILGATRDNVDGNIPADVSIIWNSSNHAMVFGTNNTERIRILAGGNVGIGTTSAAYKLTVSSDIGFSSAASLKWGANTYIYGSDNTQLEARVNSNLGWYINSSGNVGIGTSSPSVRLQVVGANSAEGQLYVGNTDVTYSAGINFTTSGTNRGFVGWRHTNSGAPFSLTGIHLFNTDNTNIVFGTNNTVKAVLNVDGNLGIGTTSPITKLDVKGAVLVNATSADIGGSVTGSILRSDGAILASINSTSATDYIFYGDRRGTNNSGNVYMLAMGGYFKATIGIVGTNNSTDDSQITFNTVKDNATVTERMRISYTGNVGIGTTSPAQKLDVIGKIRATDDLIMAQANPVIEYDGGSTGALRFYSNSTTSERMRITSDGNVGIGTTSPGSFRLDIWQNTSDIARARIKNTNATGSVSLILNTEGSGAGSIGDATIFFDMNSTAWVAGVDKSDSSKFKIANDPYGDFRGGVYFTINTSGNVGIGTDVPYTKLSVMDSNSSTTTMSSGLTIHNPQGTEGIFAGIRFGTYGDNSGGLYPKQFIGGRRDSQGAGHGDIVFANRDAADTSVVEASDIAMTIKPSKRVIVGGNSLTANGLLQITGAHVGGYGMLNMNSTDSCIISLDSSGGYDVRLRYKYNGTDKWFAGMVDNDTFKFTDISNVVKLSLTQGGTLTAAADVVAYSDARLKENIITVDNAVEKITAMRGVFYNRIDTEDKSRKVGVIAQEIQEILPEVVTTSDDGTLGVAYGNIVGVLIEAIKEQQQQIDELKYLLQTINK